MGNEQGKAPTKPMDLDDTIFEMKMQAKSLERASNKSHKEAQDIVKKAKAALKKGNEEGAKLYLQAASQKTKEAQNLLRTAHRLEAVTTQIKMNENNIAMTKQLTKLTPILQQQANMDSISNVNQTMTDFNSAMDQLNIAGNLMNEQMNVGMMDPSVDANVETMLTNLKMEVNSDINKDFMGVNQNFNYQDVNKAGMNTQDAKMKGYN
jgi:charged multivesicular body protein 1